MIYKGKVTLYQGLGVGVDWRDGPSKNGTLKHKTLISSHHASRSNAPRRRCTRRFSSIARNCLALNVLDIGCTYMHYPSQNTKIIIS